MISRPKASSYRVGLLVKNGIGLGHLRRAILVGQELSRLPGLTPVIVSQASSLDLLRRGGIRTVNLPLIERLPSNAAEVAYTRLLNNIVDELDLDLVVEDTYPDELFDRVPAIRSRPRVLLMRRIDPVSLDEMCRDGRLRPYAKILLADSPAAFEAEAHTELVRRLVAGSGRFEFVGSIATRPALDDVAAARAAYAGYGRLVVVSAGGGGNHFDDGYCQHLFTGAARAARTLSDRGSDAHFVLVYGPYFPGLAEPLPSNVTAVGFEPRLAALLHIADVALIRPGHNVLAEAMAGGARIIAAPGISWMESQTSLAGRLSASGVAYVAAISRPNEFADLVADALDAPCRTPVHAEPGQIAAAARLAELVADHSASLPAASRDLLLVFRLPEPTRETWESALRNALGSACVTSAYPGIDGLSIVVAGDMVAAVLDTTTPDAIDRGTPPPQVQLLLRDAALGDWAAGWFGYHGRTDEVVATNLRAVRVRGDDPGRLIRVVDQALRRDVYAAVLADLTDAGGEPDVWASQLSCWLQDSRVRPVDVAWMHRLLLARTLDGGDS